MHDPVAMLSIRPRFVAAIFDGSKRYELRRTCPRVSPGDAVLVYVSQPISAICGMIGIEQIHTRVGRTAAKHLWPLVRTASGVNRSEFNAYFAESRTAHALEINVIAPFEEPLPLASLRDCMPSFHPPQCYWYLDPHRARDRMLLDVVRRHTSGRRARSTAAG
jgi:predicted transcriptional regulator